MDIVAEMRGFEIDHEPEGWPAVRMRQVSALCDEVERLRAEVAELDKLREKMAGILSRTAVALRGPEPPLNAVVVEQDWPEFDLVWQMIEARMTGQQYALLLPPIADRFSELERQRDALLAGVETATRILREIAEASDGDYEDVEELEALIARVKLMPNAHSD